MFEVSVVMSFGAAHNLRGYRGKCESLHGHNWKVEAVYAASGLDELGMVIDFTVMREQLKSVLEELDHAYLNETAPFKKVNPTSENMAKFIYGRLKTLLSGRRVKVSRVKVWETESSCATYFESGRSSVRRA
jgi:6-pyruvoyltetrahydropterin/6-carboxytetrahydropterin synthase